MSHLQVTLLVLYIITAVVVFICGLVKVLEAKEQYYGKDFDRVARQGAIIMLTFWAWPWWVFYFIFWVILVAVNPRKYY